MRRLTACLGAALLALGACTTSTPGPTTTPTAPATPPVTTTAVTTSAPSPSAEPGAVVAGAVYFLRGERVVPVRRELAGPGVAASAVRELLAGPSASERAAGMSSSVPDGTALRGVSLAGGTATVDLSGRYDDGGGTLSMTSRLAQVVFTLTQFSTVERVQFRVDGVPVREFGGEGIVLDRPRTRADFEELTPEVLVDSPAFGATVTSPLRARGTANVFEATFFLRVTDSSGRTLVEQRLMATSGTGTRGTFDATLRFTVAAPGPGTVVAFYHSAKDGSEVVVGETAVTLAR